MKENKIPETVDEVVNILNIGEDLRESVTSRVKIVQVTLKRSKKSPNQLTSEWWTSVIPWGPKPKKVGLQSSFGSSDFHASHCSRFPYNNNGPGYHPFWNS